MLGLMAAAGAVALVALRDEPLSVDEVLDAARTVGRANLAGNGLLAAGFLVLVAASARRDRCSPGRSSQAGASTISVFCDCERRIIPKNLWLP